MTDRKTQLEICDECGLQFEHLVCCTDHPDYHDGYYCDNCNPWRETNQERRCQAANCNEVATRKVRAEVYYRTANTTRIIPMWLCESCARERGC